MILHLSTIISTKKLSFYIQIPNNYLGLGFKFGPRRIRASCVRSPCSVPSTNISIITISSWTLTSSQNLLAGYKCLSLAERICYPTVFTKTVHYYFTASNGQIGHNERNRVCCFNWAKQFKVPKNAVFPQNPKSESLKVKWGLRSLQITGPSKTGVHGLLPPRFLKEYFLVNADSFYANFTNMTFRKILIPHLQSCAKKYVKLVCMVKMALGEVGVSLSW